MATIEFQKVLQKPIVSVCVWCAMADHQRRHRHEMPMQHDTLAPEMSAEVVEIVTAAIDKFLSTENYEKAAQTVKDALDKKFGPSWHCVVGEGFGFNVTCNTHSMVYLYYGEKLGILVFKT